MLCREWRADRVVEGKTVDMTLPQNLAPGGYLIRHEVCTRRFLHSSPRVWGLQDLRVF